MIITIDGPAGSGKSTAARGLAERLQFHFLDTGAMYRVVAWACLERNVDFNDEAAVADVAANVDITFSVGRVFADGVDVTEAIRQPDVSQGASKVAANPGVRREMVEQQRQAAAGLNIVTEGRDQGSVVFPDAECKFFLTADAKVRAQRRQEEMRRQDPQASLDDILKEIEERDRRDAERPVSPLKSAPDAIRIETSEKSQAEVLDELEQITRQRLGGV